MLSLLNGTPKGLSATSPLRVQSIFWILLFGLACATERTPDEWLEDLESSAVVEETPLSECPSLRDANAEPIAVYRRDAYFPLEAVHIADELSERALIQYSISADGETFDVSVVELQGSPALNHSAVQAVRSWRFCPVEESQPAYENPYTTRFQYSPRMPLQRITFP